MTKEIHYYGTSGQTLYAVALASWYGLFWNIALFGNEYYNASNWADYAIPMTEEGAGIYFGDAPQTDGKIYAVIYQQAGGAPATTDTIVGKFEVEINANTLAPITDADLLSAIESSVPDPVNAVIVGWKGKQFPWGAKLSISGNDIQVAWTKGIADSNSAAYVGWAVWFELTISGYPTSYVPWLTTVVAHSGNTITVAAMPPQDLTYKSFDVYLFPPGWAGGGGGATAEDLAAAILVTPANLLVTDSEGAVVASSANVTEWKGSTAPAMTGDAYARLGAPAGASVSADIAAIASAVASVGAGDGTGYYTDTVESPVGTPVDGARVMLATDAAGANVAYEARTDAFGVFEMHPDPGTYYLFIEDAGNSFTQGATVTVVEA